MKEIGQNGVSKCDIEALFQGFPAVMPDPYAEEPRMRAIGRSQEGALYISGIHVSRSQWTEPDSPNQRTLYASKGDCLL